MQAINKFSAVAAPYDHANVDTDQILPARFLRKPRDKGFQDYLFRDLRFNDDGSEKSDFVLNQEIYRSAGFIVADRNFGGGSSREGAVWALLDYGIRCVIASSFGEIFQTNAMKNGLLPVVLSDEVVKNMRLQLHASPGAAMTLELERQMIIAPDGSEHEFDIAAFRKHCLMLGLDDIGFTMGLESDIVAFEQDYRERRFWLFKSN